MADCSKTETFIAEWKRMCDYYKEGLAEGCCRSKDCPVSDRYTHFCSPYIHHIKQKHVAAVQKWSDEHPKPFMWDSNYQPTNDTTKAVYVYVRDEETKKKLMKLFETDHLSIYIDGDSIGRFLVVGRGLVRYDMDVVISSVKEKEEELKEVRKRRNLINYAHKRIFGKEYTARVKNVE